MLCHYPIAKTHNQSSPSHSLASTVVIWWSRLQLFALQRALHTRLCTVHFALYFHFWLMWVVMIIIWTFKNLKASFHFLYASFRLQQFFFLAAPQSLEWSWRKEKLTRALRYGSEVGRLMCAFQASWEKERQKTRGKKSFCIYFNNDTRWDDDDERPVRPTG